MRSRTDDIVVRVCGRCLEHGMVNLRKCRRLIDELWIGKGMDGDKRDCRCCCGRRFAVGRNDESVKLGKLGIRVSASASALHLHLRLRLCHCLFILDKASGRVASVYNNTVSSCIKTIVSISKTAVHKRNPRSHLTSPSGSSAAAAATMTHPTADEGGGEGGFERKTTTPSYYWYTSLLCSDRYDEQSNSYLPPPKGLHGEIARYRDDYWTRTIFPDASDGSDIYLKGCQ